MHAAAPRPKPAQQEEPRRYSCRFCSYSSIFQSNVLRHQFRHTGLKPHACTIGMCTFRTSRLGSLRRHIRLRHGGSAPAPVPPPVPAGATVTAAATDAAHQPDGQEARADPPNQRGQETAAAV
jgi:hypothetical protein